MRHFQVPTPQLLQHLSRVPKYHIRSVTEPLGVSLAGVLGLLCSVALACGKDENAFWFLQSLSRKAQGRDAHFTDCVCLRWGRGDGFIV